MSERNWQLRIKVEEVAALKADKDLRIKAEEEAALKANEDLRIEAEDEATLNPVITWARINAEVEAALNADKDLRIKVEEEQPQKKQKTRATSKANQELHIKAEETSCGESSDDIPIKKRPVADVTTLKKPSAAVHRRPAGAGVDQLLSKFPEYFVEENAKNKGYKAFTSRAYDNVKKYAGVHLAREAYGLAGELWKKVHSG